MPQHEPDISVRQATIDDVESINTIHNHYVMHSTATFQIEPSSVEDRRAWFLARSPAHPVLVAEQADLVIAWGSLSPFNARAAYEHAVEPSLYVADGHRGAGIGGRLMARLIALAVEHGHHTLVSLIADGHPASIALHQKVGFETVGRVREAGRKFGQWVDVIYMQLILDTDRA